MGPGNLSYSSSKLARGEIVVLGKRKQLTLWPRDHLCAVSGPGNLSQKPKAPQLGHFQNVTGFCGLLLLAGGRPGDIALKSPARG